MLANKAYVVLAITLGMICQGLAGQSSKVRLDNVVEAYLHASLKSSPQDAPSRADVLRWTESHLKDPKLTLVQRCALYYWTALGARDPSRSTRNLVQTALRQKSARSFEDDALEALPEALRAIARSRSSAVAYDYLVSLDLDGGPGDILLELRLQLFKKEPEVVARALDRLAKGRQATSVSHKAIAFFSRDILSECEDSTELRNLVKDYAKKFGKAKSVIDRRFAAYCALLLR